MQNEYLQDCFAEYYNGVTQCYELEFVNVKIGDISDPDVDRFFKRSDLFECIGMVENKYITDGIRISVFYFKPKK
jgi:hypothetical protein